MRRAGILDGRALISAACCLLAACVPPAEPDGEAVGDRAAPTHSPRYVDVTRAAGLTHATPSGDPDKLHLVETTGTGVAVGDYDGDGFEDLYVVTAQTRTDWLAGRRGHANRLYRNRGDGTYEETGASAGVAAMAWGQGAYFVDGDGDGDLDLFVTNWGPNAYFRNEGDGTFTDATADVGLAGGEGDWSASAAFVDLDADGDLDLYVTNYCEYDMHAPPNDGAVLVWKGISVPQGPHGLVAQHDRLYRNDDGRFVEVSEAAGIRGDGIARYGLGVVAADYDDDGDPDLYVANDSQPNFLWRNEGGWTFADVATRAGVATNEDMKEQAGMGTDAGDYDGDGRVDLVVTNFSHDWNTLYRNEGEGLFRDETFAAGLRDSYLNLVWGVRFLDADDDRDLDLFVANGHIYPQVDDHPHLNTAFRQPNALYLNRGNGRFENAGTAAGLGSVESSRGLALTDIERDGDLDVVLTNLDATPTLLARAGPSGRSLEIDLRTPTPNRFAVGARVRITAGGRTDLLLHNPYASYLSQSRFTLHAGLGDRGAADRVEVVWPDGSVDDLGPLEAGRRYLVVQGEGVRERAAYATAAP